MWHLDSRPQERWRRSQVCSEHSNTLCWSFFVGYVNRIPVAATESNHNKWNEWKKGYRLNPNSLQQFVLLTGCHDVITISKSDEQMSSSSGNKCVKIFFFFSFRFIWFISCWTAFIILSLPLIISFRNLVSVFQQLYQRVIRLLRTTLWSKALHVM